MRFSRRVQGRLIGDFPGALALFAALWAGLLMTWGFS